MKLQRVLALALGAVIALAWAGGFAWSVRPAAVSAAAEMARGELRVERGDGSGVTYRVELARSADERQLGLMGRRTLDPTAGMLFDFGSEQSLAMWMRNTYVPLDMLFADATGAIVDIIERTEPLSEKLLIPRAPARYVVELLAGQVAQHGLARGQRLQLPAALRSGP